MGLCRDFSWPFIVAGDTRAIPIIAVDFVIYYNLTVDCRNRRLVDNNTTLASPALSAQPSDAISSVEMNLGESPYHYTLTEYPDITRPHGVYRAIFILHLVREFRVHRVDWPLPS